jgi:flagellar protein FliS
MTSNPYAAYRTVEAMTADPVTLTTMLFDGARKALRKARLQWEGGNRQGFNDEVNRAYLIIGELRATLDMSQGETAEQLAALYGYCLRRIVEGSLGDLGKLEEVERHIGQVGDAWRAATASLRAQPSANRPGTEAAA